MRLTEKHAERILDSLLTRLNHHIKLITLYRNKIERDDRATTAAQLNPKIDESLAAATEICVILAKSGMHFQAEEARIRISDALAA